MPGRTQCCSLSTPLQQGVSTSSGCTCKVQASRWVCPDRPPERPDGQAAGAQSAAVPQTSQGAGEGQVLLQNGRCSKGLSSSSAALP